MRGEATRELIARYTRLERPLERYLFLPGRNNNIVAQFAESLWVLGGRDDVAWLGRYLPRAPEYSDDGKIWRAAYGPRLRRWAAVDQLDMVRRLLTEDAASRRAVMALFDPARDFTQSRDIPCNNWLGWIVRDGRLHLNVAVRSNDVWWGFSGANSFEWSVLHEMLAFWLAVEVGNANYFAMSLHLYERHFDRGADMVARAHGLTPYDFGIGRAAFETPWADFDGRLDRWFAIEREIARDPGRRLGDHGSVGDPLLDSALTLMHVHWAHAAWGPARLADELARLPPADYVAALYQQLGRKYPEILDDIPHPPIARFFEAARAGHEERVETLKEAIKRLHAEKDRAYGGAWKRRGELVSILPNIARKVDRLEVMAATGVRLSGETALDTVVDLLVYAGKYCLFLAERLPPGSLLHEAAAAPLSDHEANFDEWLDKVRLDSTARGIAELVKDAAAVFERCCRAAEESSPAEERMELASLLTRHAAELLALFLHGDKRAVSAFLGAVPAA